MLKLFLFAAFLCCRLTGFNQQLIKQYVKTNAVAINSIDPDAVDFTDLEAIGNAIGNASIVMLGEQNHGDAAAFLAKSRLVKYLHEKKGFTVLAFESDFYCLNEGWDKTDKTNKAAVDSFIYNNVYPVWTLCPACNNLFYNYIANTFTTNNPLHITGIDCQLYGSYSTRTFTKQFAAFINNYTELAAAAAAVIPLIDSVIVPNFIKTTRTAATLVQHLTVIDSVISQKQNTAAFWKQMIKSLLAEVTDIQTWLQKDTANYYYRDMQMANNLNWLYHNKYAGQKIIVWAHNAHISRNSGSTFNPATKLNLMMGSFINSNPQLKDRVYSIGFTSYKGYSSWANKNLQPAIQKPNKDGFENWINKKYHFAFTDFTQFRVMNRGIKEHFYMKGGIWGNHINEYRPWTEVFDGVFFIRNMYGCQPLQ
jgi:erythromycin esterase